MAIYGNLGTTYLVTGFGIAYPHVSETKARDIKGNHFTVAEVAEHQKRGTSLLLRNREPHVPPSVRNRLRVLFVVPVAHP